MTVKKYLTQRARCYWLAAAALLLALFLGGYAALLLLNRLYPFPANDFAALRRQRCSAVILDRKGKLLRPFLSEDDNWLLWDSHSDSYRYIAQAFVAAEDRRFYQHHGIDMLAVSRAIFSNIIHRRRVSGASTITMQLMRLFYRHNRRTWPNKLQEMFRAWQCEKLYSKAQILNYYLNYVPFGSNIYGVKAAAKIFFAKTPAELTLAQGALLAGLVQAPSLYLPYRHPQAALKRRNVVLRRMLENHFISPTAYRTASGSPVAVQRHPMPFNAPHLGTMLAPRSGAVIATTVDRDIQRRARWQLQSAIADRPGTNGAIMVVENSSGAVRAFVGSADMENSPSGAIDYATRRVNVGSVLKPFIYLQAFERGISYPEAVMDDCEKNFNGYRPQNYDRLWHGKVTVRKALALSYNIPAIVTLQRLGIDNFYSFMLKIGLPPLPHPTSYYGLTLALGSTPYSLWELMQPYVTLARLGNQLPLRLEKTPLPQTAHNGEQLMSAAAAYLINDILTDQSRLGGRKLIADDSSPLKFAWKTGTSNQYREAWTFAWTPTWTVGVMLTANLPRSNTRLIGIRDAAPVAVALLNAISTAGRNRWYHRPPGVVRREVCALTGLRPNPHCRHRLTVLTTRNTITDSFCHCGAATKLQVNRSSAEDVPHITLPRADTHYLLTSGHSLAVTFAARVRPSDHRLFWFNAGKFLGSSGPGQSLSCQLPPGKYRITCVTAKGASSTVKFTITQAHLK